MGKRRFCLLLLLLLLISCRTGQEVEPTPGGAVTITVAVEELDRNYYHPIVKAFEQEHPDIHVHLISTSEITPADDENEIRALARAADILPYYTNLQDGFEYLLDLRPFIEADPLFNPNDFFPNLLEDPSRPQWSIPVGVRYPVIYFDRSAFDEAGLDYPALDWTVKDFLSTALRLTQRDGTTVTRWGYIPNQVRYSPLLMTQLERPLTENDVVRLGDADVIAAVEWVSALFTEHAVSPWLEVCKPFDQQSGAELSQQALMESGMGAMWQRTHIMFEDIESTTGVTAIPQGEHGYAADPVQSGFAISRGTHHPDAAWQVLDSLSRQPPAPFFLQMPVPARQSVAAALDYWEQLPAALAPPVQFAAENNAPARLRRDDSAILLEAIVAHIDDELSIVEAVRQSQSGNAMPTEPVATEVIVVAETEAEQTAAVPRITFLVSAAAEIDRLWPLAAQFHREHPDLQVRLVNRSVQDSDEEIDPLTGDCFVAEAAEIAGDLRMGVLPLDPLLELDPLLGKGDFYPALMRRVTDEDTIYGIPAFAPLLYLQYNRALFEAANVPEPQPDWTLDDFLLAAQQLTSGEEPSKQYGYADQFHVLVRQGANQFGLQLVDQSGDVPGFDYRAAAEMVTWYVDLVREHGAQPAIVDGPTRREQFEALLQTQRVAIWPEQASVLMHVVGNWPANMDVGLAPIPRGPNGGMDVSEVTYAYYVVADTPHREACWEWIKFLSVQPTTTRWLPAHIETAESAAFSDAVGADVVAVYRATIDNSAPAGSRLPAWMAPARWWLIDAYQEAVSGDGDVESALANAEARFARYRQCIIDHDAFDDEAQQQECRE